MNISQSNDMRTTIADFLENLLVQYKTNQLPSDEERRITEFYMKERFFRNVDNVEEKDPLTYFILGWYVLENLKGSTSNIN